MTTRPGGYSWAVVRGVLGSSGVGTPRSHVSPGAGCGTVSWELVAGFLFFSISQNLAMARKSENNPSGLRGIDLPGSPHLSSPRPQICSLSGQGPPIGACVATAEALGGEVPWGAWGLCPPHPGWLLTVVLPLPEAQPTLVACTSGMFQVRGLDTGLLSSLLCDQTLSPCCCRCRRGWDSAGPQRAPVAVWTAVRGAPLEATW